MRLPGPRIVAQIIDGFVILLPIVLFSFYAERLVPFYWEPQGWAEEIAVYLFDFATLTMGVFLYFTLQESGPHGATIGKRAMGIRVEGGVKPAWWRNIFRSGSSEILFIFSYFAPLLIAGGMANWGYFYLPTVLLWLWFTVTLFIGDGRTPYDRWAGTHVVRVEGR